MPGSVQQDAMRVHLSHTEQILYPQPYALRGVLRLLLPDPSATAHFIFPSSLHRLPFISAPNSLQTVGHFALLDPSHCSPPIHTVRGVCLIRQLFIMLTDYRLKTFFICFSLYLLPTLFASDSDRYRHRQESVDSSFILHPRFPVGFQLSHRCLHKSQVPVCFPPSVVHACLLFPQIQICWTKADDVDSCGTKPVIFSSTIGIASVILQERGVWILRCRT
ncbi:unnamed protein product [Lactuca virosa]|uniref:Uncharacterized protein n=1 Tax=Lactuca virosa TaxID=75947 RepID=A0AAU9PPL9_9ASTR|nr:unnamed protein product [Lactuca virosa]